MQIRITVPILQYGCVQWYRGQIAVVPDDLGNAFIARKEAVAVPTLEQAVRPRPETAVMPRPVSKPKPPAKSARRS
jgi:hypothetical protein